VSAPCHRYHRRERALVAARERAQAGGRVRVLIHRYAEPLGARSYIVLLDDAMEPYILWGQGDARRRKHLRHMYDAEVVGGDPIFYIRAPLGDRP